MNKKTLGALAAFAVLGLLAWAVTRAPEKGQRTAEKVRPLARVKLGDFDAVEVTKGKQATTLAKDGEAYKIVAPTTYAADDYAAKQAFEAFYKLEWGDVVTEQKAKHAEFEVGADGLRVVARKGGAGGKTVADLVVGKSVGPYTMVRLQGQDQVWQAVGSLKSTFDKDTAAWRDKTIATLKPEDVELVEVSAGKSGFIKVKHSPKPDAGAPEAPWEIVTTPVKIDKLDSSIPSGIVSALQSLKANDFADDVKPEDAGVGDGAAYRIGVKTRGKMVTVFIGNKKGEDEWYVKSADGPQIFLVKKYALERLMKGPKEFGDKTVCDLAEADITDLAVTHGADSFTLTKSGADWKATRPPAFEVDASKVTPMLGAFKDWKASSFAEDPSPKATGLGKPQATIMAKSKAASCLLRIGDETKDKQSYYAQKAGSPDVTVLTKWTVERVLKKLDDLRKPGSKK